MFLCARCLFDQDDGSQFDGLRKSIGRNLSEMIVVSIDAYEKNNGKVFTESGKYFLDTLAPYIQLDSVGVYVYQDSAAKDGQIVPKKSVPNGTTKYGEPQGALLFFGLGNRDEYMRFQRIDRNSYLVYSVGRNGLNEKGGGDDVVFQRVSK